MMHDMPRKQHPASESQLAGEQRRATRWFALLIAAATVVAFWRVFDCDFVNFDDDHYITMNRVIQGGFSWPFLKWAFTSTEFFNWHPLTWISLEIDYELYGLDHPGGYHATSLLLHIVNSVLLLGLMARMTGNLARGACVAAFFALHPLHVESVAWISERKDVMSGLFWFAMMALYARYCRQPNWRRYLAALVTFALALMAKPMVVTLPFVLLLVDFWPIRRLPFGRQDGVRTDAPRPSLTWLLVEKIPFLALSAASCVITYLAQASGGAIQAGEEYPLAARLANVPLNYMAYLRRTVWPANLAVIYPYPREAPPAWHVVTATALLVAITLLAIRFAKRWPYLFVGWFWFLGMLVPVIGLVQVGEQATADRYMYLPIIGLLLAGCWGIGDLAARWRWPRSTVIIVAGFLLAACAAATWVQVGYWRDGLTLWSRACKIAPRSSVVLSHLAGAFDAAGQRDEAERYLRTCVLIDPKCRDAQYNLGMILLKSGRKREAIKHLRSSLGDNPDPLDLGLLAQQVEGDTEKAIDYYRQAVAQNPNHAGAHQLLGAALIKQGRTDEGKHHLDQAQRLDEQLKVSQPGSFLQVP
jgi:tetratricopeptide (TPR) repeat protein